MPNYDWPRIQSLSGDAFEALLATLIVREHPDARQVNPSQGDGGVDVVRETELGLELWQIKSFTTAPTSSQWGQIRKSWGRFLERYNQSGGPGIAHYHLVTAWTPTEERLTAFALMTEGSAFATDWLGEAYIAGLADRSPETMARATKGEDYLETLVLQKAVLASSPVELGARGSLLDAIEIREGALNDIRDMVSDHYRIDHATRTVPPGGLMPIPPVDQPGLMHRMTLIEEGRWSVDTVVPRSESSLALDPIQVQVELDIPPGSGDLEHARAWSEWGIAPPELRARIKTDGGPFAHDWMDGYLSILNTPYQGPTAFLRCTNGQGSSRFLLPLTVTARTVGVGTGWHRLELQTGEGVLRIEVRMITSSEPPRITFSLGDVEGRRPASVRREIEALLLTEASDRLSIELGPDESMFAVVNVNLPNVLREGYLGIAEALSILQAAARTELLMPAVLEATPNQVERLRGLAKIYEGEYRSATWEEMYANPSTEEAIEELVRVG